MKDNISKGQGNSRYLKSVANFKALYPTYDDFADAFVAGTLPVDFNGKNNAGWQQIGTELNTDNLLSDQTASLFGLDSSAVPDDVLAKIGNGLPIKNGGTGADSASRAMYNLMYGLRALSSAPSSYYIPIRNGSTCYELSSSALGGGSDTLNVLTGTYRGTGGTGVSNAVTLTFSRPVDLVVIQDSQWIVTDNLITREWFPPIIIMNKVYSSNYAKIAVSVGSSISYSLWATRNSSKTSLSYYSPEAGQPGYMFNAEWTYYWAAI